MFVVELEYLFDFSIAFCRLTLYNPLTEFCLRKVMRRETAHIHCH